MTATMTLWQKHMRKFILHTEEAIGTLIQPILWVVLFGTGMKAMMPGAGGDYISFMVPGIIALSAQGGAIGGGLTLLDERLRGTIKEYLVSPIPRLSILMGNAMSTVTKSLLQAVVILVVGIVLGTQLVASPLGWLGTMVLVAGYGLGFAGIGLATACKTNTPGGYHMIIFMLSLPLLFISNALYPLSALPTWMRVGARINPTTYVVHGIRQMVIDTGSMSIGTDSIPLWLCFVVVGTFGLLSMALALRSFRSVIR